MLFEKPERPKALNRVKAPSYTRPGQFHFGILVPGTSGTVICDGHAGKVVQAHAKDVEYA